VPADPALELRDVVVAYGGRAVVDGVSLRVAPGEVLALLGPSGSGKSTLLAAVAGFVPLAAGEVRLGGRTVAGGGRTVPPDRRDVGMVFQDHALWPHLSALDTVAYPLRRGGSGKWDARADAAEILGLLGIRSLADRRPAELSGGEQQRVGLGRALARQPTLYLFDEPTAHLDTHLRAVFLEELAERRRAQGAAAVYATHDAEEALGLADRVALLSAGRLVQLGTPVEVYEQPVDAFAARLTGPASVIDEPHRRGERVLVRPGWALFGGWLRGRVRAVRFRGPYSDHLLATPYGELLIREPGPPSAAVGDGVTWTLLRSWPVRDPDDRGAARSPSGRAEVIASSRPPQGATASTGPPDDGRRRDSTQP
jgi:ABC-type sugar transport system ATPase subunit